VCESLSFYVYGLLCIDFLTKCESVLKIKNFLKLLIGKNYFYLTIFYGNFNKNFLNFEIFFKFSSGNNLVNKPYHSNACKLVE